DSLKRLVEIERLVELNVDAPVTREQHPPCAQQAPHVLRFLLAAAQLLGVALGCHPSEPRPDVRRWRRPPPWHRRRRSAGSFGDRHMSGARYEPNWPSASRLRLVDNFDGSTGEVAVSCPAGGGASSDGPAGPRERGRLLDGEI